MVAGCDDVAGVSRPAGRAEVGNPTYWTASEAAWLHAAQTTDFSNYDFSAFRVYTPIRPTSPQEMITKTPEPASMVLLGSGLMTLAGLIRRKTKA